MGDEEAVGKPGLYRRYPASSVLAYDGVTVAHYLLGTAGILLGYGQTLEAYIAGLAYMAFAFGQMYIIMPMTVCPNCVYYGLEGSRCVSGNNLLARRLGRKGSMDDFGKRAGRPLSHNKLYMASFILPIVAIVPGLVLEFSLVVLGLLLAVVGLLLLRFFVIFPKVACIHCMMKHRCPNAKAMGLA
jgi:hypothetical protein